MIILQVKTNYSPLKHKMVQRHEDSQPKEKEEADPAFVFHFGNGVGE